jgi:hypothetical protein
MKTVVEKLYNIEKNLKDLESSQAIQGDDIRGRVIDDERDKIVQILNEIWKDQTSYDNVLDTFQLALKGIKLVKKETQKQICKS